MFVSRMLSDAVASSSIDNNPKVINNVSLLSENYQPGNIHIPIIWGKLRIYIFDKKRWFVRKSQQSSILNQVESSADFRVDLILSVRWCC